MTYSQAEVQGQRSVGSDHRVETDRQTEAIALPPSLMQLVTSSSVIAEGPRDALSQLKSCQLLHAKFLIAPFRWKGRCPPTTVGWQKTRRIALSCGIKKSPVSSLD